MGYTTLIRFALWALLIVACTWFVWHMAATIHDNIYQDGRLSERMEWQAREAERAKKLGKEISEAVTRLNAERDKQVNALTGALQNEIKAKDKLNNDLTDIRTANRGLWIDAKNYRCSSNASTIKVESTGIDSVGTNRIRLPVQIEQDLYNLAADAQRVVIQYETLRRACLPLVEPISDPG